jgi:hypothetical protein
MHVFQLFFIENWFTLFEKHLNSNIILRERKDIIKLINLYDLKDELIEIGVARGNFSEILLSGTNLKKLNLVDPYCKQNDNEYSDSMNFLNMDDEYEFCKNKLNKYQQRIKFIRELSIKASENFSDNSIDFIYIDGNHSYKNVTEDLETFWSKVKVGGIMCGDDVYELSENKEILKIWAPNSFGKYGVHNALVDFCDKLNLKYHIFSNQFYIYKA